MGETPETQQNRDLIHILIGKEEGQTDVEIRSCTVDLAWLIATKANGNKEVARYAVESCQTRQKVRCGRKEQDKGNPQQQEESLRPTQRHRAQLLRQIPAPQAKAKAHGPSWTIEGVRDKLPELSLEATGHRAVTPSEIFKRAKELL